ncbi:MAG: hypothetical protein INR71_05430, partial [Terriglobus roseus]|nr:hypothetical protein [Terriglobus roseus]
MPRKNHHSPDIFAKASVGASQTWALDAPSKASVQDNRSAKSATRDRALTTSSYASTAVPPKLDAPLPTLGDNSYDDFDSMFDGLGDSSAKRHNQKALPQPPQRTFQRAVSTTSHRNALFLLSARPPRTSADLIRLTQDSEPLVMARKPVKAAHPDVAKMPSPVPQRFADSPELNRSSADHLMYAASSYPSSPEDRPPVPPPHRPGS